MDLSFSFSSLSSFQRSLLRFNATSTTSSQASKVCGNAVLSEGSTRDLRDGLTTNLADLNSIRHFGERAAHKRTAKSFVMEINFHSQ